MTFCTTLKYLAIARVNYRTSATYLTNLLAHSATVVLRIWIFTQLYRVTFQMAGVPEIGALTVPMVIWCLMFTQSFQATGRRTHVLIDEEVKLGTLAYSINRPYSYILFHYFGFLGRVGANIIISLVAGIVAAFILVGPIIFTWQSILAGLILIFLGYVLDFLISMSIGLSAFWLEDTTALGWLYSKAQLALGGMILPLALFPESIRNLAELLPFGKLY